MRPWTLALFALLAALAPAPAARAAVRIDGWVYDASTDKGIPGLTVRLTPPKGSSEPERLVATDDAGNFQFKDLAGGRYLLEVVQGSRVLHRRVVEPRADLKLKIPLQPKKD